MNVVNIALFFRKSLKTQMRRDQSPLQKEEELEMRYIVGRTKCKKLQYSSSGAPERQGFTSTTCKLLDPLLLVGKHSTVRISLFLFIETFKTG